MALRNSNILKNCLRNLNIGTSPECRSVICASRHLSAAVSSEDHKPICRGIKQNIGIQRGFIKYRAVLPEPSSIHVRYYAKSRDKPRKGFDKHKPEHAVELDSHTLHNIIDIDKYRSELQKVLDDLKHDYIHKLTLKTSAGAFDKILVETEDGTFPLNQIASIRQKSPMLIIINLNQYIKYLPNVKETLLNSGMNLNPQQEGQSTIYLNLTKVSHEHREELAKAAKKLFNQAKEKMGRSYSVFLKRVDKEKSKDVKKTLENMLLQEKAKAVGEAEKMMKAKQKELLQS